MAAFAKMMLFSSPTAVSLKLGPLPPGAAISSNIIIADLEMLFKFSLSPVMPPANNNIMFNTMVTHHVLLPLT